MTSDTPTRRDELRTTLERWNTAVGTVLKLVQLAGFLAAFLAWLLGMLKV